MPNPPDSQPVPDTKVAKAPDSYQPTEAEESVIAKLSEQMKTEIPVPQLKKSKDGRSLLLDHPKEAIGWGLLMNALGTTNIHFAAGVQRQLANITAIDGQIDENNLNFAFSILAGIKPNDQEEAMLGVLQVASYLSAVKMAGHLYKAETTGELEYAERVFNKCARTCATLSETLTRKRSGSQQNVTVQNVSVRDNAQAVVTGPRSKGPPKGA
jgi:hypothetical protein